MEEFNVVKNVVFSGRFPLVLDASITDKVRVLIADVEVVRPPSSPYFSSKTFPPNGFLATFTDIRDEYVLSRFNVEYERSRFVFWNGFDSQILPSMVCLASIGAVNLASLAIALGTSLGISSNPYVDSLTPITDLPNLLHFQCYADVGLSVTIQTLKYEECTDLVGERPEPPKPKTPLPKTKYPVGTPIPPSDLSPDELLQPEGYVPFPIDSPGDPDGGLPPTEACSLYNVTVFIEGYPDVDGFVGGFKTLPLLGEIEDTFKEQPPNANFYYLGVICGGIGGAECIQGTRINYGSRLNTDQLDIVIDSIEASS